jgi:hypothetical protein
VPKAKPVAGRIDPASTIRALVAKNPIEPGSKRHQWFKELLAHDGKTVKDYRAAKDTDAGTLRLAMGMRVVRLA